MLPSESSGRNSLANGIYSDKRLEKLAMRNDDCSLIVCCPKYKRRKVSAIRDFPHGCGRFAHRTNLRPTQEPDLSFANWFANGRENSIGEDGNGGGLTGGTPGVLEDLQEVVAATLRDEVIPVLSEEMFLLPSNGFVAVSESSGSGKRWRHYPPRRKFSAVRDFPPNCGRNAPRIVVAESAEGCASPRTSSFEPEKSGYGMNYKKHLTEMLSIDNREMVDNVQDGDSYKRPERSGIEVVRNSDQLKKSESWMNDKTYEVTVKAGVEKTIEEVQDGDLYKSRLEKSVSIGNRDVVQPKAAELLVLSKNKTVARKKIRSGMDDKPSSAGMVKINKNKTTEDESEDVVVLQENKSLGQGNSGLVMDDKLTMETMNVGLEHAIDPILFRDSHRSKSKGVDSKISENGVRPEMEKTAVEDEFGLKTDQEDEKLSKPPFEDKLFWWDHEFETVAAKDDDVLGSEEDLGVDKVIHSELKNFKGKQSDAARFYDQKEEVDHESSELASGRVIVQALMTAPNCPWRQGKSVCNPQPDKGTSGRKEKKLDTGPVVGQKTRMTARKKVDGNVSRVNSLQKISPKKSTSQGLGQLVVWDPDKSLLHKKKEDLVAVPVSRSLDLYAPPLPGTSNTEDQDSDNIARRKVKETLQLYHKICRDLAQEDESTPKDGKVIRRIDLKAATILKEKNRLINQDKNLGTVPGVDVGDEFQYRAELNIIGVHRQIQGGIDYMKHKGKIIATSVVASGGYADDLDNSEVLIYTGQGGNVMQSDKEPEDQKLERGNLALKNSVDEKMPVRVIRGFELADGKSDGKGRMYVYDGLYQVVKFWQDVGPHGKLVFQFRLERIPGQPKLAWKEAKKNKKNKVRDGVCVDDISQGKEVIPICAVNTIDDEKPPTYKYITKIIYPDWFNPTPPEGCNCTTKCSDSAKCSCTVKNGGEIPFNDKGAIIEVKPLVYECGPSCRCSASCHNRVSQHGIKFQLEVFKTKQMGWGVRSLNSIPSGSFVCEYIGELLREKEADARTGNDEYLFDIGNNYNDNTLWDGTSADSRLVVLSDHVRDGCFTIDAAEYGNVGRFINHSCTPNLYAQNVIYDHADTRIPRIMLFAAENIPALQELTYHYNYTIDQVRDSNGDIKMKSCFCGSHECTGRLY